MVTSLVGATPVLSGILGVIIIASRQKKEKVFIKWIKRCMIGNYFVMKAQSQLYSFSARYFNFTMFLWHVLSLLTTHFS